MFVAEMLPQAETVILPLAAVTPELVVAGTAPAAVVWETHSCSPMAGRVAMTVKVRALAWARKMPAMAQAVAVVVAVQAVLQS
jgi:hypothetical protein